MSIRAVTVDDSILFRRVMAEILASIPDVEVVDQLANGKLLISRLDQLQPDIITLDMEMPEMDGLAVLAELKKRGSKAFVIIVSSHTLKGSKITIQALDRGAFDFITKPHNKSAAESRVELAKELIPRVSALKHRLEIRNILKNSSVLPAPAKSLTKSSTIKQETTVAAIPQINLISPSKIEIIVIGSSTGGPQALAKIIPAINAKIGVPIIIVQHMPPVFTQTLAESLDEKTALKVVEAQNNQLIEANTIYLAPGGKQLKLVANEDGDKKLIVNDDPPESNCKPSVDYLFRSVALNFPGKSLAIILTGMGCDGTLGLKLLKRGGVPVIVQDEASCIVFGMPKSAIDAKVVDEVLPLDRIASRINSIMNKY